MCFRRKQIIKFDQNVEGVSSDNRSVLFVRVRGEVHRKKDAFEVPETHVAYVIKNGGDEQFYKSGIHRVFNGKNEIKEWKKWKKWKNKSTIDVIYIPKETNLIIPWGTPVKFKYRDFSSSRVINIGANGQFRIEIKNPEQFRRKVVGPLQKFVLKDFQKEFLIDVINEFRDVFLRVVKEEKLTYDEFDANLKLIGSKVGKILSNMFEGSWGIGLADFYIKEIFIEEEDMNAVEESAAERQKQAKVDAEEKKKHERLKEILAELERLEDKQWEREKYLRQLELQDKSAYYEVMKVIGNHVKPVPQVLKCPVCQTEYKATDKFCPHCGKRVSKDPIICPVCGRSNHYDAKFCVNCGKSLVEGEK